MDGRTIKEILNSFLTDDDLYKVKQQIENFPHIDNFYDLQSNYDFIAQGDGIINNFEIYDENLNSNIFQKIILYILKFFINKDLTLFNKKRINAFIISNTCDIDENNIRSFNETNILFTPIIELKKYRELLERKAKLTESQINSHIQDIKNQNITSIIYLPNGSINESIVFLDKIYNCRSSLIDRKNIKEKRNFSLSLIAFYLLLTKLTIHFSRPGELSRKI